MLQSSYRITRETSKKIKLIETKTRFFDIGHHYTDFDRLILYQYEMHETYRMRVFWTTNDLIGMPEKDSSRFNSK